MSTASSTTSQSSLLTWQEVSKAADYLIETRDGLVDAVTNLSDSQWNFKPESDCWSIAENLEHIILIEERVHTIVGQMAHAPVAEVDRVAWQVEEIILSEVPKRATKIQAPVQLLPSGRWSPAESVARFLEDRTRTIQLLREAPALRGHVLPHPILGTWDGYQWILAAGAHGARHTAQILELKARLGFPESNLTSSVSSL